MHACYYDAPVITADDIRQTRDRIAPHLVRTPLVFSRALGVWLKLENRQHTGSFKARGALARISRLTPAERAHGIVAASAGNHALGVAHACQALGIAGAKLFLQSNASRAKIAKLSAYPVEVTLAGETFEDAQQAALAWAEEKGATFISAYDDEWVMAGQGTAGLEIVEEMREAAEAVVVPVGGGALLGGIAIAVKDAWPNARVIGVNPEVSPSALESLRQGRAIDPFEHGPTRAHGLAGGFGKTGFEVARRLVDEIVLVSELEMSEAIAALIDAEQMIAEPSGSAALAALLAGKVKSPRAVALISGGNVDAATLGSILAEVR